MFYVPSYSKAQTFWEVQISKTWRFEQYTALSFKDGRPYLCAFSADEKIPVKKTEYVSL